MVYGIAVWLPQVQSYAVLDHNLDDQALQLELALRGQEGRLVETFTYPRPHKADNSLRCRACQRRKVLR